MTGKSYPLPSFITVFAIFGCVSYFLAQAIDRVLTATLCRLGTTDSKDCRLVGFVAYVNAQLSFLNQRAFSMKSNYN